MPGHTFEKTICVLASRYSATVTFSYGPKPIGTKPGLKERTIFGMKIISARIARSDEKLSKKRKRKAFNCEGEREGEAKK